jgi:hypothetical protein
VAYLNVNDSSSWWSTTIPSREQIVTKVSGYPAVYEDDGYCDIVLRIPCRTGVPKSLLSTVLATRTVGSEAVPTKDRWRPD